jgi:hypothetical protein
MSIEKISDPTERKNIPVTTVPISPAVVTGANVTILAGGTITFVISTIPDVRRLGLWNFKWTIRIDTDAYAYRFRDGESLTSNQRKLRIVTDHDDYDDSDDLNGIVVRKITLENFDVADHTYYMRFKGYTLASLTGESSS